MELKVLFKSSIAGYASGSLRPRPAVCLIKRLEFTEKQQDANHRKDMGDHPPFPLNTSTLMLNMERKEKVEEKEMNNRARETALIN